MYHCAGRWYNSSMPTSRHRYQVTETDEVARALDTAARLWPEDSRSRLIVRVIVVGGEALADAELVSQRRAAIARLAGRYSDDYGPNYLDELRKDWPA